MRQLVQSVRSGELRIIDAPDPLIGPTEVLVATTHSVVSAGTEKAVRKLASASLLQKAKARPDLVRQVIRKARTEGIRSTYNAVQTRLDEDMPLGYSGAGVAVAVGEHVSGIRPGMRVATGGAGHGDLQVVVGQLTVPIPDGVSDADASFATVAAIALHGLRLAEVGPGSKVCVIGLGLIGQIAVRLAQASGLDVVGVDLREWTVERAIQAGARGLVESGEDTTRAIMDWSRGRGVDAVLLTAATQSSEPARRAAAIARDRGTIVVVGDVGLELERTPLYEKELTLRVARSYGPGRYERSYEEWAVDYPAGHVRWTEGRNLEAVLDLMASGRLKVEDLVTHRFHFDDVAGAYDLLGASDAEYLGIQLEYPAERKQHRPIPTVIPADPSAHRIGLIGAGNFARMVLVPSIIESGLGTIVAVASAGGASAAKLADQLKARAVTTDELIDDPGIDIVVIATSHSTHAELTIRALSAGKHVFCEKPLAITYEELDAVERAWLASGRQLVVGFNRRYSSALMTVTDVLTGVHGPKVINYKVSAGSLPSGHWYKDRLQGGRLLGEVCHFIDTCEAIVGSEVDRVSAFSDRRGEASLSENLVIIIAFVDGSLAAITYSDGGHPSTPKERIEVHVGGQTVVINDFISVDMNGVQQRCKVGKGHVEQLQAWQNSIRSGGVNVTLRHLRTSAVSLEAVLSLLRGNDHELRGEQ